MAPGMLESLRVCCGFAGGLVGSGLTSVIDSTSAGITIDGENTVLYLQLARWEMGGRWVGDGWEMGGKWVADGWEMGGR